MKILITYLSIIFIIFGSTLVHSKNEDSICINFDDGTKYCPDLPQQIPCKSGTTYECSGGTDANHTVGTSGGGTNEIPQTELQNHKTSTSSAFNNSITTHRKTEISPTMKIVIDQKMLSPQVKD